MHTWHLAGGPAEPSSSGSHCFGKQRDGHTASAARTRVFMPQFLLYIFRLHVECSLLPFLLPFVGGSPKEWDLKLENSQSQEQILAQARYVDVQGKGLTV